MTSRCVFKLALAVVFPLVLPITGISEENGKSSDSSLPLSGELKVLTWPSNPTASVSTSLSFPYEVTLELYSQPCPLTEDYGSSPPKGILFEKMDLAPGEKILITDGLSVRAAFQNYWGFDLEEYQTWLKVCAGDREGWVSSLLESYLYEPETLVRFNTAFSPLRVAPADGAEAVRQEVTHDMAWALRPFVPAGQIYAKVAYCNGWWAVGRGDAAGWLPADTRGLEVYNATIKWEFDTSAGPVYTFFFGADTEVTRIIYTLFYTIHTGRLVDFDFLENPVLTLTTGESEINLVSKEHSFYGGVETGIQYYEAILTKPVKRDDITAFTFAVGKEDNRKSFTIDPRPAWAGQ